MNVTKRQTFEAHFQKIEKEHSKEKKRALQLANNFAYGKNGFPLSLVDAFYWYIRGRGEKAKDKLDQWQSDNEASDYPLKSALPSMMKKLLRQKFMTLIINSSRQEGREELFNDAIQEFESTQQKEYANIYLYWVAAVFEHHEIYNATLLYYKIHTNNKNRAPQMLLDASFAALIQLCNATSNACTRTSMLIRLYNNNRLLAQFIPYIDQCLISGNDTITATKEHPLDVADQLLRFAVECSSPDPEAVIQTALRYGPKDQTPSPRESTEAEFPEEKYLAKALYQSFVNKRFNREDRDAFRGFLIGLHNLRPNHPYVTYQTGRLYVAENKPLKGYDLIMEAGKKLDIPPETFCDIADKIKEKVTSPKLQLDELDAVMQKSLIIASDHGSTRACLDLANLFDKHLYIRIAWAAKGLKLAYLKFALRKDDLYFANDEYRQCLTMLATFLLNHPVPYDAHERMRVVVKANNYPLGRMVEPSTILHAIEDKLNVEQQVACAMGLATSQNDTQLEENVTDMINDFRCLEHLKNVSESNNILFSAETFDKLMDLLADDLNVYRCYRRCKEKQDQRERKTDIRELTTYADKGNLAAFCALYILDPSNKHHKKYFDQIVSHVDRLKLIHYFALTNQKPLAFFIFECLNNSEFKQSPKMSANLRAYIEIYHGLLAIVQPTFDTQKQASYYEKTKMMMCQYFHSNNQPLSRNSGDMIEHNITANIFTECTQVLRKQFLLDEQERQFDLITAVEQTPPEFVHQEKQMLKPIPRVATSIQRSATVNVPRRQKSSPRVTTHASTAGSPVKSKSFGQNVNLRTTPLKARPRSKEPSGEYNVPELARQHTGAFKRVLSSQDELTALEFTTPMDTPDSSQPGNDSISSIDGQRPRK